jgi:predicted CXXCH cytochrome family protein
VNLGCEECHLLVEEKVHQKNGGSIRLWKDMPALCFKCHKESAFTGQDIHPPVAKGMCDTCHDPHHSDHRELLKDEPRELCFKCHAKEKYTRKYVHKVALGGCGARCHNPHSSDYPRLLSMQVGETCIGCHRMQQSGTHIVALPGGRTHPISGVADPKNRKKEMNCVSCHNPHSSNYEKLFTTKRKCVRCHKY